MSHKNRHGCPYCPHCIARRETNAGLHKEIRLAEVLSRPIKERLASVYRKFPTAQEKKLGDALRSRHEVRRQFVLGPFIADFCIPAAKLIIEADGIVHQSQKSYDARRDKFMQDRGYQVLRLSNNLIEHDLPFALQQIRARVERAVA